MKKYTPDGEQYEAALMARDTITRKEVIISSDGYDVSSPSDAEIEYAQEMLGKTADIIFFEGVV
jgi:hypothetical protein